MRITVISDTHGRHLELDDKHFPGGDLLIHAGDFLKFGTYKMELKSFCQWYDLFDNYINNIFVAGNHDLYIVNEKDDSKKVINNHKWIEYLQDDWFIYSDKYGEAVKIWGSPWTPKMEGESVFTPPRDSEDIKKKWNNIPNDVDLLLTHSPPYGILDNLIYHDEDMGHLGCKFLLNRVKEIKPKIHIFGHIHGENEYYFDGNTHYINAALMDDKFFWCKKPITFDWNIDTNEITFL